MDDEIELTLTERELTVLDLRLKREYQSLSMQADVIAEFRMPDSSVDRYLLIGAIRMKIMEEFRDGTPLRLTRTELRAVEEACVAVREELRFADRADNEKFGIAQQILQKVSEVSRS